MQLLWRIKAKIQVKTTQSKRKSVQIKLSNLHTQAIDISIPHFIILVVYDNNKKPIKTYIKYFDKALITRTLKKIREKECQVGKDEAKQQLHQPTLSITLTVAEQLKANENIKNKIASYIPNGMNEYINKKKQIIESVGYSERPTSCKISVTNKI